MKHYHKWMRLLAVLVPGVTMFSCVTDFRDAAVTGAMDFVSGSISNTMTAAWPLAELLTRYWNAVFTGVGL